MSALIRVWAVPLLLCVLLLACAPAPGERRLLLEIDGERRWIAAGEAETVGEAIAAVTLPLDANDRLDPPSFTLIEPDMLVQVIRVDEREVAEERDLPFPREVRRDASLPQGESRVVQLGQNGRERVVWRVSLENGEERAREEIDRETLIEPLSEVVVIGTRGSGAPITFQGTIAYLEQGNAWLMRENSADKRPLTRTGDLDGHVFNLSNDGRWLLFTRTPLGGASGQGGPINTLWIVNTRITNDEPRSLELDSVLWADWEPCAPSVDACPLQVAYSTGERVPSPPGWRASNDLHRFGLNERGVRGDTVRLLAPSNPLFGWWGRAWEWSPNGRHIAWGDATRIGVVEIESGEERILAQFLPFETRSAWVWTPQLTWATDERSLLATVHRGSGENSTSEERERSERFDIFRIYTSGRNAEVVVEGTGPFAMPRQLSTGRLFYGQAEDSAGSVASRYDLMLRDGNEPPQLLFPTPDQPGVDIPWSAWNELDDAIITVWQGDVYMVPLDPSLPAQPLTAEGGASHPQWGP